MNEFEKLLVLLVENNIKFITVGGMACSFNGYVRATEDVDIIISLENDNIFALINTLSGYHSGCASELTSEDFTDEEGSIRINEIFPIDIFTRMSGYHYNDFLSSVKYFNICDHSIPYLDKSMLIHLKENSLREQDAIDVIKLKELI